MSDKILGQENNGSVWTGTAREPKITNLTLILSSNGLKIGYALLIAIRPNKMGKKFYVNLLKSCLYES
jgi:hypothetical protein